MDEVIKKLAEAGVRGGTILDGSGMARELVNMSDLPFIDMLKHLLADEENSSCKVMLFVLKEEQSAQARQTIKKVVGNLNEPNSRIMFTIPVSYVEGLG